MSKRLVRLVITILVIVLAVCGGLYLCLNSLLNQIPRFDPEEPFDVTGDTTTEITQNESLETTEPEETLLTTEPAEKLQQDDHLVNILLIGHNGKARNAQGSTHTMILCTLNKTANKLTLTSFHSDLWVNIPGHRSNRLHTAGKLGGAKLLNETIAHNFGVKADHSVMINLSEFVSVIDTIGGIEISLLKGEAECLNAYAVREKMINETWNLREGSNVLTGAQTLAYSRMEESGTDFGRNDRQKTILLAILSKLKTMDLDSASKLVKELLKMVATDMTNEQIMALLTDLIPMFGNIALSTQSVPAKGT